MQYMCITYLWYVVVENVWFFSSLGSCTGLIYSLLTLSYVTSFIFLITLLFILFCLCSCIAVLHFLNPFILGTHLISSLRYCVSCIIAYKLS